VTTVNPFARLAEDCLNMEAKIVLELFDQILEEEGDFRPVYEFDEIIRVALAAAGPIDPLPTPDEVEKVTLRGLRDLRDHGFLENAASMYRAGLGLQHRYRNRKPKKGRKSQ